MAGGAGCRRCLARAALCLLALAALITAGLFVLAQCSNRGAESDRALPRGFEELGVPGVEVNAYLYGALAAPLVLPMSAVGGASGGTELLSVEALVLDPDGAYAARFALPDADAAARVAAAPAGGEGRWTISGSHAHFVSGQSAWSEMALDAWDGGGRTAIAEWDAAVWDALQLLPERPPAPPFAAGFTRNSGGVAETLLRIARVDAPGLGAGLSLLRIDPVAFAAYGELDRLPSDLRDTLLQPGVSALAVGRSSYPGAIVGPVFDGFAGASGMERVEVDGEGVRYTLLEGGMHLMVEAVGPAFYFAVSPTREGVEAVVRSVLDSLEDE